MYLERQADGPPGTLARFCMLAHHSEARSPEKPTRHPHVAFHSNGKAEGHVPRVLLSLPDLRPRRAAPSAATVPPFVAGAQPFAGSPPTAAKSLSTATTVSAPVAMVPVAIVPEPMTAPSAGVPPASHGRVAQAARPIPVAEPLPFVESFEPAEARPATEPAHSAASGRRVRLDHREVTADSIPVADWHVRPADSPWFDRTRQFFSSRHVWYVIAVALLIDLVIVWKLVQVPTAGETPLPDTTSLSPALAIPQPRVTAGPTMPSFSATPSFSNSMPPAQTVPSLALPRRMSDELPTPQTLGSPASSPAPPAATNSPLPATPTQRPLQFPSNAPRLGDPADQLPWENWPAKSGHHTPERNSSHDSAQVPHAMPPGSLESASNTPAALRTVDGSSPRMALRPNDHQRLANGAEQGASESLNNFPAGQAVDAAAGSPAADSQSRARLMGTIRKPATGREHERTRSGLY